MNKCQIIFMEGKLREIQIETYNTNKLHRADVETIFTPVI